MNTFTLKIETTSPVYPDETKPVVDPQSRAGWYFKNSTAGKKINWYIFGNADGAIDAATLGNLRDNGMYALVQLDAVSTVGNAPFMGIYTIKNADSANAGSWYKSRLNLIPSQAPAQAGLYLLTYGDVPDHVYASVPRLALVKDANTSNGAQADEEVILSISLATNSSSPVNTVQLLAKEASFDFGETEQVAALQGFVARKAYFKNDFMISDMKTWLLHKAEKADVGRGLNLKADAASVYHKGEVDTKLLAKADADAVFTKDEIETKLNDKANAGDLAAKANASAVYTKGEVDSALSGKADSADIPDISGLASASAVYTKGEVDNKLSAKADSSAIPDVSGLAIASAVYTKGEVDSALSGKADASAIPDISGLAPKSTVYTKGEVDGKLAVKLDTQAANIRISAENTLFKAMSEALHIEDPAGSGVEFDYASKGLLPEPQTVQAL